MADVPATFDQPGDRFILLPAGLKFPPLQEGWQLPENAHGYAEALAHDGNIGILAGDGYIGLDEDDPSAFKELELPITTAWETRPGRIGLWLRCSDLAAALTTIGKKADLAQLYLYRNGKQCGEIKLQRSYQTIPPSWKTLEDGTRADYILLDSSSPAKVSLVKLLDDLQAIGVTFANKLEQNASRLEKMVLEARRKRVESDDLKVRRYAETALRDEVLILASTPEGGRNDQLNKSAFVLGQFAAAGVLSEAEIISDLSRAADCAGLNPEEIRRTILSGLEAGRQHPREIPTKTKSQDENCSSSEPKKSAELPKRIKVNDRGLDDITNNALEALIEYNDPPRIFSRSGSLVRLHKNERYVIEPLTRDSLKHAMARSAMFYVLGEGERVRETEVSPPNEVANNILAADDWPGIPEIKAIIETPVIRPDGSILFSPGYDEATKLYLDPIMDLSGLAMPEVLTQKHAAASAKFILDEIFADFPFENNASRTNTLATLLAIIVRPLIKGNVPITILDKPQAGTGASLIADIISIITTGRPASMWGMPETEDEWRKAITSALIDGSPVIVIDNVTGRLQSASLARALTAKTWQDRILGKSQMVALPQEAVWIATGNNIQIGGDIARRAIWVRLDAAQARPWTRTEFRHPDILGWIRENHDSIIAYLLIMARAWVLAGNPKGNAKLGGFNEWADVISGILEYAGVKDFMGNAAQLYDEMDQDVQQWDAFLGEWSVIHGDNPISAGMLRDELTSLAPIYTTFRDSMPDDVAEAVSKTNRGSLKLGVELRKHLNQFYPSGRKLAQVEDKHNKAKLWQVASSWVKDDSVSSDPIAGSAGSQSPTHAYAGARGNMVSGKTLPALPAGKAMDSGLQKSNYPQSQGPTMPKIDRPTPSCSRHICRSCGKHFDTPLVIASMGGYICEPCRRNGPPSAPPAPDPQTKLDDSGAKAA